jgi:hypothetical protein
MPATMFGVGLPFPTQFAGLQMRMHHIDSIAIASKTHFSVTSQDPGATLPDYLCSADEACMHAMCTKTMVYELKCMFIG